MFKDVIELIYIVEGYDTAGYPTKTETKYTAYAMKKSVVRSEFYSAMRVDLKPKATFVIRAEDWEQTRHTVDNEEVYPSKINWNSATYDIIRADGYREGFVELVVE